MTTDKNSAPFQMPGSYIHSYAGQTPRLGRNVFLASSAQLIGDLEAGDDCSFWFNTTTRADCNRVRMGARVNVQDNTVIHVTHKTGPTTIGSDVTIGHGAVIHACTIGNFCLIGMGAIILDGAIIPDYSFVAAGALVSPGKTFPSGMLIKGSPAVAARPLRDEERQAIRDSVKNYLDYKRKYMDP